MTEEVEIVGISKSINEIYATMSDELQGRDGIYLTILAQQVVTVVAVCGYMLSDIIHLEFAKSLFFALAFLAFVISLADCAKIYVILKSDKDEGNICKSIRDIERIKFE